METNARGVGEGVAPDAGGTGAGLDPPASLWEWMQRRHPRFKYDVGHQTIASLLEAAACGGVKRLLITVPPGIGLSSLVSVDFAVYYLGKHPDSEVLAASANYEAALSLSRSCQGELTLPLYAKAFGCALKGSQGQRAEIDGEIWSRSAQEWRLYGHHGGYKAVGVGMALAGVAADLVILDAPVRDWAEAHSKVCRAQVVEWYRSTVSTRMRGKDAAMVVAMPRFHRRDLAGWIKKVAAKEEPWLMLNLPALDSRGESLWPSRFSTERYQRIRAQIGEADFAARYMGEPRKKGE